MSEESSPLEQVLGGPDRRQLAPSPTIEVALQRAGEREQRIRRLLGRFEISPDFGRLPEFESGDIFERPPEPEGMRVRVVPAEFSESGPEIASESPEFRDRTEASAHTTRLRWQLARPELLLAERFVDWLLAGIRQPQLGPVFGWRATAAAIPAVQLACLPAESGVFPWRVILRTDTPETFAEPIRELAEWFGIGVDVAPQLSTELHGRCQAGIGALNGSTGGALQRGRELLPATCAHVLSHGCRSQVPASPPPEIITNRPDAALLETANPCFPVRAHQPCPVADSSEIDRLVQAREPVVMNTARRGSRRGALICRVSGIPLGSTYTRFPHVQIIAWNRPIDVLKHPIARGFSEGGDSGNWVFAEQSGRWIGMITAGIHQLPVSVASEAQPLLDHFQTVLNTSGLFPHRFVHP